MTFRFCLMGSSLQALVDVPVASIGDLHALLDSARFITGHLRDADEHGVQAGVLIASSRVQMVIEAD